MRAALAAVLLSLAPTLAAAADHQPDPRTVQRFGPAYRYPQAGWVVLHVEGEPYPRGVQHGRLLAPEIAAHLRCFAALLSPKAPAEGWKLARTLTNALFVRSTDREYLEEMKGIADGASAAGARFDGRRLDLIDIAALNAWPEIETLDHALEALPTGLEGVRFPPESPRRAPMPKPTHCSAFAATGPATRDGKIVFGHITMFGLYPANFYNVWLDVKPARGHRVLMQSFPGGIHSGMDYYMNDAGLLISETTISQTRFNGKGTPLASRIRQAAQYADNLDKAVAILRKDNNGLYTNEWLLGDTKTNEIAMLELGTHKSKLWRSSKDEWFGGTRGFYWGCNNPKDLEVRLETLASTADRPRSLTFVPSVRDRKWLELFDRHAGKMDAGFGKLAFTTPPLAAFSSLDAKFTTSDMAKRLETWALFGPPMGRTWQPTHEQRVRFPEIKPLVSHPWTVLRAAPPDATKSELVAADLHDPAGKGPFDPPGEPAGGAPHMTAAWHGTLLPKEDGDVWLTAGFAAYERHVALENALRRRHGDDLPNSARDRLAVNLFAYRTAYETAARAGKDVPLIKVRSELRSDHWHRLAQGKGVLLLHRLRGLMGAGPFERMMDDFGTANAGKEVTTAGFRAVAEKASGEKAREMLSAWLERPGLPEKLPASAGPFSVATFYSELEQALIVYGTADEEAANRESAEALQQALRRRGQNVTVPIRSDREAGKEKLEGHHLLLVGRPATNRLAERLKGVLPVTFGPYSCAVNGQGYAHPDTAILAAGENPGDRRFSVVLVAGLGAASTRAAVDRLADGPLPAGEVVILRPGKPAQATLGKARNASEATGPR